MSDGQLALNTNLVSPGLFFKDSNGDSVKIGPVHVGTTAPNVTPGAGGQAGNSKGELWLDTSGSDYSLKTWDGTAFRAIVVTSTMIKDGTIVDADVNASAAIAGSKVAPNFGSQTITTTGVISPALGTAALPSVAFTGNLNTGIFSPGADQVAISTGGTARILVDSAGTVEFGSAGLKFTANVIHKTVNTGALTLFGGTSGDGANIELYGSTSGSANHVVIDANVHLFRSQAGSERMRSDSSGNLLIRRTANTDNAALCVDADAASGGVAISTITTLTTQRFHQLFRNGNGQVGGISTTGSATTYSTSSDYRLKENIAPLDGAIDRLNQFSVHRFNFIANPDTVVDGFIAHEAAAVVPECVTGVKDEEDENGDPIYQGIDQSKIVPLLTAALQEAIAKIEVLEQRFTAAGIA
jgi:hypothetical protein